MKKNSLVPNNGLSLSQAQSISNLCYQRALEITGNLKRINNYSKSVYVNQIVGNQIILSPIPLPNNIVSLLKEKAELHACQAFLMENIKAKDEMLKRVKNEMVDISELKEPNRPDFKEVNELSSKLLNTVDESWGWEQLTTNEINEYIEAEAYASHIGQFIHKGGVLDKLREELPTIPNVEWMDIKEGEKSLVNIEVHHESDKLQSVHEELANIHREYESKVNYFKSKVKNLVTSENSRIAKHNSDIQIEIEALNNKLNAEYTKELNERAEKIKTIRSEFEKTRQEKIAEIVSMRINVDPRFQKIVDKFMALPKIN